MDWGDEQYVKLYKRDTYTWLSWPWQARALFGPLIKKLTGAGIMEFGCAEMAQGVSVLVLLPAEVVAPGLDAMLKDGTIERAGNAIIMPKFIEAQEATKTERAKKRDQRERVKAVVRAQGTGLLRLAVPSGPEVSRVVPLHPSPPPPQPTTSPSHPPAQPSSQPMQPTQGDGKDWAVVAQRLVVRLTCERELRKNAGLKKHRQSDQLALEQWALDFCLKHWPDDEALAEMFRAFIDFLDDPLAPDGKSFSVWAKDNVWDPRWKDQRTKTAERRRRE